LVAVFAPLFSMVMVLWFPVNAGFSAISFTESTKTEVVVVKVVSGAEITVSPVLPGTAPMVAVMVVEPVDTPVARPLLPAVLEMVAMLVADEDQVTELVMFWVLASE